MLSNHGLGFTRAVIIVSTMILSSMAFIGSPVATAFPTLTPLPSEYLFYDDFEDGLASEWYVDTGGGYSAPTVVTNLSFQGTHAAYFGATNKMLRYNLTDSSNICIEAWFYDISSDTTELSSLVLNNATSNVRLGVRTLQSGTLFSAARGSSFYSLNYYRTTGWTNLKMTITDTTVKAYINNDLVGEFPFTNAQNVEWRSEIYTTNTWIDDFIIYKFWQDAIWTRPVSTTAILTYNASWSQSTLAEPNVMYEDGIYKMWYRGVNYTNIPKFNHPVGLGYATSTDGLTWTEYHDNPVAPLGWCPTVHKIGSTYYLYDSSTYAPGGIWSFGRKTSTDGITWTASVSTDLTVGTGTWDDQYLGNNEFWYEDGTWHMLYECSNLTSSWKIGYATSTNGMNWTKYAGNPVIGTVMRTAGGPHIQKIDDTYYCWYHIGGFFTEIAMKQSTDLHTWIDSPFLIQLPRDPLRSKESRQTADPIVLNLGSQAAMYYCGTNNDSNGEIFVATSKYTIADIAQSQINQWGRQWTGDIGTTNNITDGYPRTYWYRGANAMKGTYFYDWNVTTNSDVNITIISKDEVYLEWTADGGGLNPTVTFTFTLEPSLRYRVYANGVLVVNTISSSTGSLSFSVLIGSTTTIYEVIAGDYDRTIVGLGAVLGIFMALGIIVPVVVLAVDVVKHERKLKTRDIIDTVIFIVITTTLLGIVYAILP